MTQADLVVELTGRVRAAGSQKGAAKLLGISHQYLNDVLAKRRDISANLAASLGYDKVVTFVPKQPPTSKADPRKPNERET